MRAWLGFFGCALLCVGCSGSAGSAKQESIGAEQAAGAGGAPGSLHAINNVFVDQIVASRVDKIDILFTIDNSPSMADKQQILAAAVPLLLGRLVSPRCVDVHGKKTRASARADGTCAEHGSTPEFTAIDDIHIGIVSSSLGAHGGSMCEAQAERPELDDRAHLIGTVRGGLTSWHDSGFLAWDPAGTKNAPPGESDPAKFVADFSAMVQATGERGCSYEAPLESWYRFLIDAEPPQEVYQENGRTVRHGIDTELLAQRLAFLRPDSLLAIVMLSDENDCSIRDEGLAWMVGSAAPLPKATASCATNPNDACCRPCTQPESATPRGCAPSSVDPGCTSDPENPAGTWDSLHDALALRCFEQQQRFGFDLLYPTDRYVAGLTRRVLSLPSNPGTSVINPLFDGGEGRPGRDPALVFLAGIVGVPWQDIATDESLTGAKLEYLTARELRERNRWPLLLGDASVHPPVPPTDPFMIESALPRQGVNPVVHAQIEPATSSDPKANRINGHEQNVPNFDDLQYACIFPLSKPKECLPGDSRCDCSPAEDGSTALLSSNNSPVCQPPEGGSAGTTQYFAKAYPGTRELTVLRDFGENAIAASICPKQTTSGRPSADPNYGYNPAIEAIVDRLKEALGDKCLRRAITTTADENGGPEQVIGCNLIEAALSDHCDCAQPGRSPGPAALAPAVFKQLKQIGRCGDAPGQSQCDAANFCLCQINQETGEDLSRCVANQAMSTPGFCYIDDPTSSALWHCPAAQPQVLRFIEQGNAKIPAADALLFLACDGSAMTL